MKYNQFIDSLIELTFSQGINPISSEFVINKSMQTIINGMLILVIRRNIPKDERIAIIKIAIKRIKMRMIKRLRPTKVNNEEFYLEMNKLMKSIEERLYNVLVK